MIGFLRGIIIEKKLPTVLLDVGGVGYEVDVSMTTFYQLPEKGQEATLLTHLAVREDAHNLYGFAQAQERELFRALIKVNGVGAKLALTILSSMEPNTFVLCINHHDAGTLVRIPGVGKKTAERLIIEMADRLKDWQAGSDIALKTGDVNAKPADITIDNKQQEAYSALVALGYKPQEATRALKQFNDKEISVEDMVKQALQGMIA